MALYWPIVFNLVNSIIGVSVLAIPFCFHECGVILGALALLGSAFLAKKSCVLLLTSSQLARRKSYESLAQYTYGAAGKLAVEASIIGLCFGTLCAFHVIIGDLAPSIFHHLLGLQPGGGTRPLVMTFLAFAVGLPLSLMRNISSLAAASAMSLIFYAGFVTQVFVTALPHLMEGSWMNHIYFWRPSGILRCLPIFALACACQTPLFVLYDSLPEPSVKKMEAVVNVGMNIVSCVYLSVGFLGYITYYDAGVNGDVLTNYGDTFVADILKMGFVMSVIVSIPLMVFPMRASINSLLFPSQMAGTENMPGGPGYMPQNRFVFITVTVVCLTLAIGILIPQIEFVLGLTGATMGTLISFIFPASMFLYIVQETQSNMRTIAKIVLGVGLICFVGSTYSVLTAPTSHHVDFVPSHVKPIHPMPGILNDTSRNVVPMKGALVDKMAKDNLERTNSEIKTSSMSTITNERKTEGLLVKSADKEIKVDEKSKRLEPAVPHAPDEKSVKLVVKKNEADPLNEKRQLMSAGDLNVSQKKEGVEKPAAQGGKSPSTVTQSVNLDPKIEVSEAEINSEIRKLKQRKAQVDADIKDLEELKGDKTDQPKSDSRGRRHVDNGSESKGGHEPAHQSDVKVTPKSTEVAPARLKVEPTPSYNSTAVNIVQPPQPPTPLIKETTEVKVVEASTETVDKSVSRVKIRDLKSTYDMGRKQHGKETKKDSSNAKLQVKRRLGMFAGYRTLWSNISKIGKRKILRSKGGIKVEVR